MRRCENTSTNRYFAIFIFLAVVIPLIAGINLGAEEKIPYKTGSWDPGKYGNHRAVVQVDQPADAVAVHIPWRRRDHQPEKKNILIIDAKTGQKVKNLFRLEVNREFADLAFQPATTPGKYYIYYLPYTTSGSKNYPKVHYVPVEQTAAPQWLAKHQLTSPTKAKKGWKKIKTARVLEFQAIDEFNSFYPMGVIATRAETETLLAENKDKDYLLFIEDREHPIRMTGDLPRRWIERDSRGELVATAAQGEYFVFQVGVYAFKKEMERVDMQFPLLQNTENVLAIPPNAINCFNTGGNDWTGKPFYHPFSVKKGKIKPLWFGVYIPERIRPGTYKGNFTFRPKDMESRQVTLTLNITKERVTDYGDGNLKKLSRLRWLDSGTGLDAAVVPPFTPVTFQQKGKELVVGCLGRSVTIGDMGLPNSIQSFFTPEVTKIDRQQGREILASPLRLVVEDAKGREMKWQKGKVQVVNRAPGLTAWQVQHQAGGLQMGMGAWLEMDGFLRFNITLTSPKEAIEVKDIRLEIPIEKNVAKYLMGLGQKGGIRPPKVNWKWNKTKNQDSAWLGDVNAGLQYSLLSDNYSRPLNTNFYQLKPLNMPDSWYNAGKGGMDIAEVPDSVVLVKAYSGARTIEPGKPLRFYFTLLVTPFKPIDTAAQWKNRFYHRYEPLEKIKKTGANVINVHHATEINPYINYPFLRPKQMKAYIDKAHDMGMKVKIYYTVRELANRAPEMFALRSLGDEVLSYGPGGGPSWLQEHIGGNYIAGWLVPKYKDAALVTSGVSRWHNYYVEGLDWLVKNTGIDGLYIDDVAFDRTVMKRVRKVLVRNRPGAMIDLHSANQFNPRDGFANSANLYLEHFPYIDRLWFGEYFDYNSKPDFWMTEVSGIPFGLMGEMLQDGGNPWRGMVFGMTARLPWAGDPRPLWKTWDDFGIQNSEMFGYWSPRCPIKTGRKDVLATAYVIPGKKTMIALASWADADVKVSLSIDWKALGLKASKKRLAAPAIKEFQGAATFTPKDKILLPKGKGLLLILE